MLRRVREKWITGVLEPSLANAARLVLGLQPLPDVLRVGERVGLESGRPVQSIPAEVPISEVFDKVGGGLLILGAPGAGKTTLLLELARDLLDRAEYDPDQPLPVVANLASWARQRGPFGEWLADELAVGYTVPRRLARAWVEREALVLLLDGLDEVADEHRPGCIAALNAWRDEHGLVPLVVCSRTAEYQALQAGLRAEAAVELRPPSDPQVDAYLGYLEAAGTPLAEVRAAMAEDSELRELLRSPLMLHVVALAYHGRPAPALAEPGSVAVRQARLWGAYVARMFEQRPLPPDCGYSPQQACVWLAWLARALRDRDQTEFYLDRLGRDWLATPAQRRAVRWATGALCGLGAGLVVLLVGLVFGLTVRTYGLVTEQRMLLVGGLIVGLAAGRAAGLVADWGPSEEMGWSLRRLRENWHNVRGALLIAGLLVGLATIGLALGLSFGLTEVLGSLLAAGLLVGLGVPLIGGLARELRYQRTMPNEGIRRSARNALVAGLLVGPGAFLIALLVVGLIGGLAAALGAGLLVGLAAGLGVGLVYGGAACVQHYLIRAAMTRQQCAPWRYGQFLEAMTKRLLLRRAGSAYVFIHRLLRDYLAESVQAEQAMSLPMQ